jgi:hypothetical protein
MTAIFFFVAKIRFYDAQNKLSRKRTYTRAPRLIPYASLHAAKIITIIKISVLKTGVGFG